MKQILILMSLLIFNFSVQGEPSLNTQEPQANLRERSSHVSSELFDLMAGWRSGEYKTMPIETYVLDKSEEHFIAWMKLIDVRLGMEGLSEYFKKNASRTYYGYLSSLSEQNQRFATSEFIEHVISTEPTIYYLFKENVLAPKKLTLEMYFEQVEPEFYEAWANDLTKGSYNIYGSLSTYIDNNYKTASTLKEAQVVLKSMGIDDEYLPTGERGREDNSRPPLGGDRGADCNCSVNITANSHPINALIVHAPVENISRKNNGSIKKSTITTSNTMGPAHGLRIDRYAKGGRDNEAEKQTNTSYHSIKLQMGCLNEAGFPCSGLAVCTGEIATRAHYYSDLKTNISTDGGILGKKNVAAASDGVKFAIADPGVTTAASEELLAKTLAISVDYNMSYDTASLLGLVGSAVQIGTAIATGTGAAAIGAATNSSAKHAKGLIKEEGSKDNNLIQNLVAEFDSGDTYGGIPFSTLEPVTLTLTTNGKVQVEGKNGNPSTGWAQLDSAYALMAGAKNFSCTTGVTSIPDNLSYWAYGRAPAAVTTEAGLKGKITSFLDSEMNETADFSSGSSGEVLTITPDVPPTAICSISPNLGINSLAAVMTGTSSFDPDGDITAASFEWVRFPGHPMLEDVIAVGASSFLSIMTAPKYYGTGLNGIHLRVTDTTGLSSTSNCGEVRVLCVGDDGLPCPIAELTASPMVYTLP